MQVLAMIRAQVLYTETGFCFSTRDYNVAYKAKTTVASLETTANVLTRVWCVCLHAGQAA